MPLYEKKGQIDVYGPARKTYPINWKVVIIGGTLLALWAGSQSNNNNNAGAPAHAEASR